MTPIAQALSAALLHFIWQGLLVASLLWTTLLLLKHRSPQARYLAASAALALQAVLPALTVWALYPRQAAAAATAPSAPAFWQAARDVLPASGAAALPALESWLLPLWAGGVFVFSIRLAWGCRQIYHLRRSGAPAPESIVRVARLLHEKLGSFRQISLLVTPGTDSPSVIGWLHPVVLLPAATILGLSAQQLEAVLAHELSHVRRHDYLVNLFQNLIETLLFYHPAVWWTSARMREERELCCDDAGVRACGDAVCYARALTTLEKMRLAAVPLAMGSTGGPLLFRIRRLMGLASRDTAPPRLPVAAALLLGAVCVTLNMPWARAQQERRENTVSGVIGYAQTSDSPGVQVDLGGAQVTERSRIEYPGSALERKVGGIVVVEATLAADGNVSDARVLSGPAELRRGVLQSVLNWRFAPAAAGTVRQISVGFQWDQAQNALAIRETRTVTTANGALYSFRVPEGSPELETTRFLEEELEKARQSHAAAPQIQELESKLERAQAALQETEHRQAQGVRVSRIDVQGMDPDRQKALLERVPVRIGEPLTVEQQVRLIHMVSEADPPLALGLDRDQNNLLVIRISPGTSR